MSDVTVTLTVTLALDGAYCFSIILHGGLSIGFEADKTLVLRPARRARRAVLAVGVAAASVSAASGSQPDFRSKMPRRARCNYICIECLGQDPETCKSFHLPHKRKERAECQRPGSAYWISSLD